MCIGEDTFQMIRPSKALCIDFVNTLSTGETRGEPSALGKKSAILANLKTVRPKALADARCMELSEQGGGWFTGADNLYGTFGV